MKKIILTTIAILLVIAACFSCGKNDKNCSCGEDSENNEFVSLEGTQWKLAGIMDVETCNLKELEPKDCGDCYTLEFNTDSTALGKSVINIIFLSLLPKAVMGTATEVYDNEIGDVQLSYDAMKTIVNCTVTENEIKFCCNDGKNYLLYRKYY
ncbi:MAG: hypothetical protein LBG31_01960 [Prevotellaceae bacterium]|jgi:hypothetical protein|nr:hypothetical protein [Prevotellaceae bacterium]